MSEPGVSELDDGALLEAFAGTASDAAFTTLVERHAALVRSTCTRILSRPVDIDDATQATWMVLASKAADLERTPDIGPWLHAVARRCALAVRRQQRRRGPARAEAEPAVSEAAVDSDPGPALGILDELLTGLPELERAAVVLCHLEGHDHLSVARKLGIPSGSLSRVLARGLERLRQGLRARGVTPAIALALLDLAAAASTREWVPTAHAVDEALAFARDSQGPIATTTAGAIARTQLASRPRWVMVALGIVVTGVALVLVATSLPLWNTRAESAFPAAAPVNAPEPAAEATVFYRVIDGAADWNGFIRNWDDEQAPVLVTLLASELEWEALWQVLPVSGSEPAPPSDEPPIVPSGVTGQPKRSDGTSFPVAGGGGSAGAQPVVGRSAFANDLLLVVARVVPAPVQSLGNPLQLTGMQLKEGRLRIDYRYSAPAQPETYSIKVWFGIWLPRSTFTEVEVWENGTPITQVPLPHP